MRLNSNARITLLALTLFVFDQASKWVVRQHFGFGEERVIVPGFFKFVHWGNTGAAWSLFRGNNTILAVVAVVALVVLFFGRHHFDSRSFLGQTALGLIFGGITGNLIDRILRKQVIDFLYFYLRRADESEIGFPAFNVADSAICTGVALIFLLTWRNERRAKPAEPLPSK